MCDKGGGIMTEPFEKRNLSAAQRVRMQLAYGKYELVSNNILNLLDEMDTLEQEVERLQGELARFRVCDVGDGAANDEVFGCKDSEYRGEDHKARIWHRTDKEGE